MNVTVDDAFAAIRTLLDHIPSTQIKSVRYEADSLVHYGIDGLVSCTHAGVDFLLAVQIKSNGAPRYVRAGIYQLESYIAQLRRDSKADANVTIIPVMLSQYLSPEAQVICMDHDVAYLDLYLNQSTSSEQSLSARSLNLERYARYLHQRLLRSFVSFCVNRTARGESPNWLTWRKRATVM